MTNIKITAFTDIGNNIAPTTLVPVVDMAGTPTTKKSNLQNVGNLILNGAGGSNFVPAARAILSQSVTNAAQPNITSTGTLTSLTVSGNVNLGSVTNLTITGGTSGQILSTDGNGTLSWVNDANSSYGDSNVVTLLSAFGSNTITTTGLVTGDGGGLSNVPYANVTGTPTLGNVSAINLDGNVSNVLRGDGTFAATSGSYDDSNVAAYLPNYGGNILVDSVVGNTTDNLGYMRWVGNSSGDGNGYTTIEVVPDDTLTANDQYLIIDPTVPSHVHIRAGGNIDDSQAELYLGGEVNYVRVIDGSGVRLQNQTRDNLFYSYSDPGTFTDGSWYESGGTFFVQYTTTDAELIDVTFEFNNDNDNTLEVTYNAGADTALLTSAGSISSLGGGVYRVSVNEEPPTSPTVITALEYTIWNTRTNFARLQSNDFTVSVEDDVRITGNDLFSLRNRSNTDPITIRTDYDGADYAWEFSAEGILTVPNEGVIRSNDDTVVLESYDTANAVGKGIRVGTNGSLYFDDGSDTWLSIDNVSNNPVLTAPANSYVRIASNNGTHNWYFESDGNLTLSGNTVAINFANGTAAFGNIVSVNLDGNVSNVLRGDGTFAADANSSYGDSNVASLLGAFGSNSISTTGNITATRVQNDANLEIRSNVAGAAKIWTFDSLGDINLPVGGNISGSGYVTALRIITDPVPLANLTAVAGGRAFVSDGNLVATGNFGAQIGSGGSNTVPVWSDGTNWYIG
jgi:hypothetical protein